MLFQLKQGQNYIESRQQYWLAIGALECGWAQLQQDWQRIEGELNESLQPLRLESCTQSGVTPWIGRETLNAPLFIQVKVGFVHLRQELIIPPKEGDNADNDSHDANHISLSRWGGSNVES